MLFAFMIYCVLNMFSYIKQIRKKFQLSKTKYISVFQTVFELLFS